MSFARPKRSDWFEFELLRIARAIKSRSSFRSIWNGLDGLSRLSGPSTRWFSHGYANGSKSECPELSEPNATPP